MVGRTLKQIRSRGSDKRVTSEPYMFLKVTVTVQEVPTKGLNECVCVCVCVCVCGGGGGGGTDREHHIVVPVSHTPLPVTNLVAVSWQTSDTW